MIVHLAIEVRLVEHVLADIAGSPSMDTAALSLVTIPCHNLIASASLDDADLRGVWPEDYPCQIHLRWLVIVVDEERILEQELLLHLLVAALQFLDVLPQHASYFSYALRLRVLLSEATLPGYERHIILLIGW